MNNKIPALLGFASKAGQIVTGTAAVEAAIKKHRVYLVICASDLAPRTLKNFDLWCQTNQIQFSILATRTEIGHWVGKPERGIIGITSNHFANSIRSLLNEKPEAD